MITWIEGQNSSGKTILVKKLLGAIFTPKEFIPINIVKNPPDIKNDFPDRLIPSDFVFYYDISMPKHITFNIKNSQIHIFLKKVRGNAVERNKIFKLFDKFIEQRNGLKEREQRIKRVDDEIKSRHEGYQDRCREYKATKTELEEKIERHENNWYELIKKLENHKKDRPGMPFTTSMKYNLENLKNSLEKYKKKLVTKEEIFKSIKDSSLQKNVWIDGKPSSQFKDFYDLIEFIGVLSPEELFISHCGNKIWFHDTYNARNHLNLNNFKKIWIEVPSMHDRVFTMEVETQ